ncbi:MAG: hypothetical protein K940chlam7_00964 [Chlamydiae bacterium]|nr:hypothetical protein [Chlamydiota bacterium]
MNNVPGSSDGVRPSYSSDSDDGGCGCWCFGGKERRVTTQPPSSVASAVSQLPVSSSFLSYDTPPSSDQDDLQKQPVRETTPLLSGASVSGSPPRASINLGSPSAVPSPLRGGASDY